MKKSQKYRLSVSKLIVLASLSASGFVAGSAFADNIDDGHVVKGTWTNAPETGPAIAFDRSEKAAELAKKTPFIVEEQKITEGGIEGGTVDITAKAVSVDSDATAFKGDGLILDGSDTISEVIKNPEAINLTKNGGLKGNFEASTDKGTAVGVDVTGDISSMYSSVDYLESTDPVEVTKTVKSEMSNLDITVNATSKNGSAYGIKAAYIRGGNESNLNVAATSTGAEAVGVSIDGLFLKDGSNLTVSSTAKTFFETAKNAENKEYIVSGTVGDAFGIKGSISSHKNSTTTVEAISEGGNATGIDATVGGIYNVKDDDNSVVTVSAVAKNQTFTIGDTTDPTVETTDESKGGNATAIIGDVSLGNLSTLNANAVAEGGDSAVEAKALFGRLSADKSVYQDIVKTTELPVNVVAQDSIMTVDISAKAGALAENGDVARIGSATAIEGDISFGSAITLNNSDAEVPLTKLVEGVEVLDTAKVTVAAGTVELNGKIAAEANGADAFGINGSTIDLATRYDVSGTTLTGVLIERGDFNADVTAVANNGGNAIAINAAESIFANVNGDITAKTTGDNAGDATAIAATATKNMVVNGTVRAESDNTESKVNGIISTDGIVNLGDGAQVIARTYDRDTATYATIDYGNTTDSAAISDQGAGFLTINVDGKAVAEGNVVANSPLNINNGKLEVVGGVVDTNGDGINIAKGADLSFGINRDGQTGSLGNVGTVVYAELHDAANPMMTDAKNAFVDAKRNASMTGTATALVGDKSGVDNVNWLSSTAVDHEAFHIFEVNSVGVESERQLTIDEINQLGIQEGDRISFEYVADADLNMVGYEVKKLSYFTSKYASDPNAKKLGSSIDSMKVSNHNNQDARLAANALKREFKDFVDTKVANVRDFMPQSQSYIAQMNSAMLTNMNFVHMYRLSSYGDNMRNNKGKYDAASNKNVAEFQSINMLGSQDGGDMAAGYDFLSAGGVAAIDRNFSDNVFAGISLGGVYNKVEGNANSGDANSTSFVFNVYGNYSFDEIPLDVFANFGYAHSWNETFRYTAGGSASSEWDSNSFYHLGGVSYTFKDVATKGFSVKPMSMYNMVYSNTDASNETGAGDYNLSTSSKDYVNFKTLLGLEAKYDITAEFSVLARLFWVHEFGDNDYDVDYGISYAGTNMLNSTFTGEATDRDSALLGLGLNWNVTTDIAVFLDYNANITGNMTSHGLNLGGSFRF